EANGVAPVYELAVVGAGGFLGSATMRVAQLKGVRAVGFDRGNPPVRNNELVADIRRADAVAWCASRVNPRLAQEDPRLVDQDRADLEQFLSLLAHLESPPQVVLLSSGGTVYGPPSVPPYAE